MRTPRLVSLTIGLVLVSVLATASGTAAHAATKTQRLRRLGHLVGPITAGHIIEPASAVPVNLAANGYVEQEFFASGTAHAFTATSRPSRRPLVDHTVDFGPLPDPDHRPPPGHRREVQRHRGRRVDERLGRESAPDWDYLNPDADSGRLRLRGRVGPGAGRRRRHADPRRRRPSAGLVAPGAGRGTGRFIIPATSTPWTCSPRSAGRSGARAPGQSWAPSTRATSWPSASPSPPSSSPPSPTPSSRTTHAFDGIFIHSRGGGGAGLGGGIGPERRACASAPTYRAGVHVRDPDRSDRARLRRGPATQHRPDPHLGGGRDLARRRLPRGQQRRGPGLHPAHQRRAAAPGGPGRVRGLRQVGGPWHAAALTAAVPAGQHRIRPT